MSLVDEELHAHFGAPSLDAQGWESVRRAHQPPYTGGISRTAFDFESKDPETSTVERNDLAGPMALSEKNERGIGRKILCLSRVAQNSFGDVED